MRVRVLLNERAGALNTGAIENPVAVVEEAFRAAGHEADVRLVAPERMQEELEDAARSDCDCIVGGGGDGTFSLMLASLAGSGKTLGLLALGTMNLMGRDMYEQTGDLAEMAHALANGSVKNIDLARVNGRPFHTLCGLGYFARVAAAREQTRYDFPGGRLLSVLVSVWRSVSRSGRTELEIDAGERKIRTRAYATLITCNRMGEDWRRARLDEGVLELHLMRASHFAGRAKAGFELVSGSWREGESIESITAGEISISTARSRIWLAVDGELIRENTPLRFTVEPGAVPVLMPEA